MSITNLATGRIGEMLAARYLQKKGFKILAKNFRSNKTEIDIIAQKDNKIHFVEVKTRMSTFKGKPYEAVGKLKISHLLKTATYFLLQTGKKEHKLSLDVVSILLDGANNIRSLQHFENINS